MRGLSGYYYPKIPRAHPQNVVAKLSGWQYTLDQPLEEDKEERIDWPPEWDTEGELNDAWAVDERQPQGLHFTPKVAPSLDGRISWFAFEEAIYDWLDIAKLAPDTWALSLKAILVGDASIYKTLLDRERLRDPNDGVDYFKIFN